MDSEQAYSGERFDPSQANALAHYDHHSRYHFVRGAFGGRSQLLDVGCGLGIGSSFLSKDFQRVVGVDPSPEAIESARGRNTDLQLEFHTISDFEATRGEERFDVVTCLDVIEHTLEQAELIELVKKRVGKGGVAVFSTPNLHYTRAHGIVNPFHVKELTAAEFFGLLASAFPHVQRWGMVQYNGAAIVPVTGSPVAGDAVLSAPQGIDVEIPDAAFSNFVGVCSFEPMPPPRPLWLADIWCTYTNELQRIVDQEAKMVDERDALILKQDELVAGLKKMVAERDLQLEGLRSQPHPEAKPLRYKLVDSVNELIKRTPLHRVAKRLYSSVVPSAR